MKREAAGPPKGRPCCFACCGRGPRRPHRRRARPGATGGLAGRGARCTRSRGLCRATRGGGLSPRPFGCPPRPRGGGACPPPFGSANRAHRRSGPADPRRPASRLTAGPRGGAPARAAERGCRGGAVAVRRGIAAYGAVRPRRGGIAREGAAPLGRLPAGPVHHGASARHLDASVPAPAGHACGAGLASRGRRSAPARWVWTVAGRGAAGARRDAAASPRQAAVR